MCWLLLFCPNQASASPSTSLPPLANSASISQPIQITPPADQSVSAMISRVPSRTFRTSPSTICYVVAGNLLSAMTVSAYVSAFPTANAHCQPPTNLQANLVICSPGLSSPTTCVLSPTTCVLSVSSTDISRQSWHSITWSIWSMSRASSFIYATHLYKPSVSPFFSWTLRQVTASLISAALSPQKATILHFGLTTSSRGSIRVTAPVYLDSISFEPFKLSMLKVYVGGM